MKTLKVILCTLLFCLIVPAMLPAQTATPKAIVNGAGGGTIPYDVLISSTVLVDQPGYEVTGFTVTLVRDGDLVSVAVEGNRVSKAAANYIRVLPAGNKVFYENIRCKDASGQFLDLGSLTFIVSRP